VLDLIDVGMRADGNKRACMIRPQPPSVAVKTATARRHQGTAESPESCRANGYYPVNTANLSGAIKTGAAQDIGQRLRHADNGKEG
jgi:hypothetical protein